MGHAHPLLYQGTHHHMRMPRTAAAQALPQGRLVLDPPPVMLIHLCTVSLIRFGPAKQERPLLTHKSDKRHADVWFTSSEHARQRTGISFRRSLFVVHHPVMLQKCQQIMLVSASQQRKQQSRTAGESTSSYHLQGIASHLAVSPRAWPEIRSVDVLSILAGRNHP